MEEIVYILVKATVALTAGLGCVLIGLRLLWEALSDDKPAGAGAEKKGGE